MTVRTVILCSYGPRKATHGALRRLRAMMDPGDQLLVYAGTRAGQADPGKTSGVEVVEAIGRDGLLAALERVAGSHVLHLTDGITLTAGGLRKLFEAARDSGKLVTPWTNDLGTDHYIGALSAQGNQIQALADLGRHQPEAAVRVLRPMCVAGTLDQILGLVPHHLSYPTTILRLVHDDCIAVAGVVAVHNGSAGQRLLPPVGPEGRPLLVASMIVRNEEQFLGDCLRSLEGFVDRIDLCDTGSTDRTLQIARDFGCQIIERPWRNDFGWARNEVLELSRDAWYALWIDADERIIVDDLERVRQELATGVDHFDGFNIALQAATDGDGGRDETRWSTTRILSPSKLHFQGSLHEQLVRRDSGLSGVTVALEGIEIEHHGYSAEVIDARDKRARNLAISKKSYEDDPTNPVNALHYARSLWLARSAPSERIAPLETAHEGFKASDPGTQALVKGLLARTLIETREPDRALDLAQEALDLVPADDTAFCALLETARTLGRTRLVLQRIDAYAHGPSLRPVMEDPAQRARNRAEAIRLMKEAGQHELALRHTTELLTESHQDFPHWDLLIDGLLESKTAEEFVVAAGDLLTNTEDGGWARPLATRVRRDISLALIEAHLAAGGRSPEPVRVGLTLAMLMKDEAALMRLIEGHGDTLPHGDRMAMAERLAELGHAEAAARLRPNLVPSHPTFIL